MNDGNQRPPQQNDDDEPSTESRRTQFDQELEAAREKRGNGLPAIVRVSVAYDELPEAPPQIIKGLLYEGAKMMISGPSKARKTWGLCHLAVCVAEGLPWMGLATNASAVLYLNYEMQEFDMARRIRAICEANGRGMPPDLYLWHLRGHSANLHLIHKRLVEFTIDRAVRLIVVDPIYKVLDGLSENNAEQIGELLGKLDAVALETGAGIVFSHHFAKGSASSKESIDRASGTGVWARDPDALMTLTQLRAPECMGVETNLRNFPPLAPFAVRWEFPIWKPDADVDPLDFKRARSFLGSAKSPNAVLQYVPADGTIDGPALIRAVQEGEGLGERRSQGLIAEAVASGKLFKEKYKLPKRRDGVRYALPTHEGKDG